MARREKNWFTGAKETTRWRDLAVAAATFTLIMAMLLYMEHDRQEKNLLSRAERIATTK